MGTPVDQDTLLKELYPHLSDDERMGVKEFLSAYFALILRICEDEERELTASLTMQPESVSINVKVE